MNNRRTIYTEGALAKRYYEAREASNGFLVINGGKPSSYSSRYIETDNSFRWIFVFLLMLAAYVVIAGLQF